MYIQITTRCNMRCPHCCYSCTNKGEDMSLSTFRKAIELDPDCIAIGGGEPTLHRQFERFLLEAIAASAEYGGTVWLATNGSIKRRALMLAHLTKRGTITAELSIDAYHAPIDDEVYHAFDSIGDHSPNWSNKPGIRDITKGGEQDPKPQGRALELLDEPPELTESDCACTSWFVKPDGSIHQCGCFDSPQIGHVDTGIWNSASELYDGECWRSRECINNGILELV